MKLGLTAEAEEDLVSHFDWYEEQRPGLGNELLGTGYSFGGWLGTHGNRYPVPDCRPEQLASSVTW